MATTTTRRDGQTRLEHLAPWQSTSASWMRLVFAASCLGCAAVLGWLKVASPDAQPVRGVGGGVVVVLAVVGLLALALSTMTIRRAEVVVDSATRTVTVATQRPPLGWRRRALAMSDVTGVRFECRTGRVVRLALATRGGEVSLWNEFVGAQGDADAAACAATLAEALGVPVVRAAAG